MQNFQDQFLGAFLLYYDIFFNFNVLRVIWISMIEYWKYYYAMSSPLIYHA